MAQPFDPKLLALSGEMFPVAAPVPGSGQLGFGAFTVSENGTLAYRTTGSRQLIWVDRTGKRLSIATKPGRYGPSAAISLDQTKVAVEVMGSETQSAIWFQDLGRGVFSPFTTVGSYRNPVWSPDGSHLVFARFSFPMFDIYQKATDGTGPELLLLHAGMNALLQDWSTDGRWIVYQQLDAKTKYDLWLLPLEADGKPIPYLQTPFNERNARFAPNANGTPRWMAYQSDKSGQDQVYVQAIPATGREFQVSTAGGTQPVWQRDGQELFYVSPDQKMMAVPIRLGATVEPGTPHELFVTAGMTGYAPSPDGQRFLVNVPVGSDNTAAPPITVVLNWTAAFRK
jgi:serine/threonine-protein kinase